MYRVKSWVAPLLALALVLFLAYLLLKPAPSAAFGLQSGQLAPTLTLRDLEGQPFEWPRWPSRPLLLNFWASWCGPCQAEAPILARLQREFPQLQVIGIVYSDPQLEQVRQFVQRYQLHYPQLLDPGGQAASAYGVTGIPYSVFIDQQGQVRRVVRGELSWSAAQAALQQLALP